MSENKMPGGAPPKRFETFPADKYISKTTPSPDWLLPLLLLQIDSNKTEWKYCPHCGSKLDNQEKRVRELLKAIKNVSENK